MKKRFYWYVFLLSWTKTFAQTSADSGQFEAYIQLIEKYDISTPTANPDSALYYAHKAVSFAEKTKNNFLIGQANFYHGHVYAHVGWRIANNALGKEELHKAAAIFKALKNKEWYIRTLKELYILESYDLDGKSEKAGFYQAIVVEGKLGGAFVYPEGLQPHELPQPLTKATNLRVINVCEQYIALLQTQQDTPRLMYAHEVTGKYYISS